VSETIDQVDGVEAPTERDDVRADVMAAFKQHTEAAEPAPKPERVETEAPKPAESAADRARDAAGRFARADGTDAEPAAPEPSSATPEPAAPVVEAKVPTTPPDEDLDVALAKTFAYLPPADREKLAALTPEAREFVLRRVREQEVNFTQKTQALAAARREYEPIEAMFRPHMEVMRQKGLTPAGMIQQWGSVENALAQGGQSAVDTVARIVANYPIDRAHLAAALGIKPYDGPQAQQDVAPQQQYAVHPELMQQVQQLQNWAQQQEQMRIQSERAAHMAQHSRVQNEIDQFATAVDKSGALQHPYFHDVERDMEYLAQAVVASGRTPVLSELYDQAVWANTSTREKHLAGMRAADEAQRARADRQKADEARAKAEKARRASSPISGAPGHAQVGGKGDDSLRGVISRAVQEHAQAV
jgi:hypothetical protein